MPPVVIVLVVGVLIFAVAAGTIGREARRLDSIAPRAVYLDSQAVDYVAACLPADVQQRVTVEELWALMRAHLNWLHARGLMPDQAADQLQDIVEHPVVMEQTNAVGYLIGVAGTNGIDVDDVAIVAIVDGHLAYLGEIGAIGPPAEDPEVQPGRLGRSGTGENPAELPPAP